MGHPAFPRLKIEMRGGRLCGVGAAMFADAAVDGPLAGGVSEGVENDGEDAVEGSGRGEGEPDSDREGCDAESPDEGARPFGEVSSEDGCDGEADAEQGRDEASHGEVGFAEDLRKDKAANEAGEEQEIAAAKPGVGA